MWPIQVGIGRLRAKEGYFQDQNGTKEDSVCLNALREVLQLSQRAWGKTHNEYTENKQMKNKRHLLTLRKKCTKEKMKPQDTIQVRCTCCLQNHDVGNTPCKEELNLLSQKFSRQQLKWKNQEIELYTYYLDIWR